MPFFPPAKPRALGALAGLENNADEVAGLLRLIAAGADVNQLEVPGFLACSWTLPCVGQMLTAHINSNTVRRLAAGKEGGGMYTSEQNQRLASWLTSKRNRSVATNHSSNGV